MDRAVELLGSWELGGESSPGVPWSGCGAVTYDLCTRLGWGCRGSGILCELEDPRTWALLFQGDSSNFTEQLFNRKFHFYCQVFNFQELSLCFVNE